MPWKFLRCTLFVAMLIAAGHAQAKDLLWQTNAGGDDIHIYDFSTGVLVRRLIVGANPHGLATTPSLDTVFVSLERNGQDAGLLLWINKRTLEIDFQLEVGPEPHAIAVTPDGKWVYVPCRDGNYWVIDSEKRIIAAKIHTGGRPHNTTASPNGEFVYLSPMGDPKSVSVVAPHLDHKIVGSFQFSNSVRPPAISEQKGHFFQHVDGLNGFEVADLISRERVARIEHITNLGLPIVPQMLGFLSWTGFNRCHGLAVRPGDQEIWSICGRFASIHALDSIEFNEISSIELPGRGYWLTFSPDGRFVFIALSERSEVAMFDTETRNLVRLLPAGRKPKRNLVISAGQ
jgi:hypothetical protein